MTKRVTQILSIILAALMLTLVACGPSTDEESDPTDKTQTGRIGIVYTMTGRGDMAFNDLTYKGAMRAAEDFDLQVDHVEPKTLSEMEMAFEDMSSSGDYDLIVGISFEVLDALQRTAPDYPEQKYAIVDTAIELDNVVSYIAEENEAAFLMGVFAGLLNVYKPENGMIGDDNVIGLVAAVDAEIMHKHIAGYTTGAKYVNPDIEVLYDYVGSFGDTATAQTLAETMNNMGADIVYNVAAGGGLGIFKAAEDKGFIAFGLDNNQCPIAPDNIPVSMLKKVDEFVYSAIADVVNDEFKGGEAFYMGLEENGVGYTTEGSNIEVDAKIIEIVEEVREMIVSGELEIPTLLEQIDDWVANNKYEG